LISVSWQGRRFFVERRIAAIGKSWLGVFLPARDRSGNGDRQNESEDNSIKGCAHGESPGFTVNSPEFGSSATECRFPKSGDFGYGRLL
jgi:hypothetical protein